MTQKLSHNVQFELDLEDELLDFTFTFTYEECYWCGNDLINPKYIYTDLDSGNYCCRTCSEIWGLNAVQCMELDY